jgi:hypothetical protein
MREMYKQSQPDLTDDAIEAEVVGFKDRWRHRLLATIGADSLPDDLKEALADFDARFGAIAEPVPSREIVTRYPEPQVSIDLETMRLLSDDGLVTRLLAREPDGLSFRSATYRLCTAAHKRYSAQSVVMCSAVGGPRPAW